MRRPTMKDVALKANVSGWTVSNVINGRADIPIAAATRKRVLSIAREMGYRPNHIARALASNRTHLIALWMRSEDFPSPYYVSIQHQLQQLARMDGYQCIAEDVMLANVDQTNYSELLTWPTDGVIASDTPGPVSAYAAIAANSPVPIVNLGVWVAETADYVRLDIYPGAVDAVRHLIDVGCRRISYVAMLPYDRRAEAYATVLREHSMEEEYILCPVDSRVSAREAMLRHVHANGAPDGLFCENDEVAIGCFRALCELGIKVPDEVAIVGCDGIIDGEFQSVQISTIKAPVLDLCETAWKFLRTRIRNPEHPRQHCLMTAHLEIRESSQR